MTLTLDQFGLAIDTPLAVPSSRAYRPPSWPPPRDWVCIEDKDGNPVSRWGDPVWHLWPWIGKTEVFNFGDGPKLTPNSPVIDPENADILRLLVTWKIWGPRGARALRTVITGFVPPIRKIIALCSEHKILATDLSRYPVLIEKIAKALAPSAFDNVVAELDRLRDAREFFGFAILDRQGLQHLKAGQQSHEPEQTEYIPPRIWNYVVGRTKECIDDYMAHREQIEACFAFCLDAYEKNGVREFRLSIERSYSSHSPFSLPKSYNGKRGGAASYGSFADTAQRFGIKGVIERWIRDQQTFSVKLLSTYLSLVQTAALVDLTSFTLMRINEAMSVRRNCLLWQEDEVYGRIPLIQAETTKTDPDENAVWIASPSVEPAIRAMTSIANMRLACVAGWYEEGNQYLVNHNYEPWFSPRKAERSLRARVTELRALLHTHPKLLELSQMAITEDDLKLARAVCPTLNRERFQVGKPWPLAWHQFRRTGAVNMFASGEISDSSIQLQMKHLSRLMPLYYGRGNSTLHLNNSARVLLVNAQYEAMGRQLAEVHTNRFVSPYGDVHKAKMLAPANNGDPVNLIGEGDARTYERAARKHHISFRLTPLGGCMKNGQCDGDCVTSIGDCAGGEGQSPCVDVLFDRNRAEANQIRLNGVLKQLESTPLDTPRYHHLKQERCGLENYFAFINRT